MLNTLTKRLILSFTAVLAATQLALAAETGWEYKDFDSQKLTRSNEMEQQAKDGWQLRSLNERTRNDELAIMARRVGSTALPRQDYQFVEMAFNETAKRLTDLGERDWEIVTLSTRGDKTVALLSRLPTAPLEAPRYEYNMLSLGRTGNIFELVRAGHDSWEAVHLLQRNNEFYALARRDKSTTAKVRKADFSYKWTRLGVGDPTRALANETRSGWELVDVVVVNRAYEGLLIRRGNSTATAGRQYLWREINPTMKTYVDELNKLGKEGWALREVTPESINWMFLFEK